MCMLCGKTRTVNLHLPSLSMPPVVYTNKNMNKMRHKNNLFT